MSAGVADGQILSLAKLSKSAIFLSISSISFTILFILALVEFMTASPPIYSPKLAAAS
jgi:hypothetical protein